MRVVTPRQPRLARALTHVFKNNPGLWLSFGLGLSACSAHHTSDEVVLEDHSAVTVDAEPEEETEKPDSVAKPIVDAGVPSDASAAPQCNQTDVAARLLCTAGLGGAGLDEIISGVLGGGMSGMSCAKETDPIAALLCGVLGTAGTGLEGLVGGLLGDAGLAGLLSDGGIERVITNTLVEVTRGLIDDLLAALFSAFTPADAGTNRRDAGVRDAGTRGTNRALVSNTKAREPFDLVRSADECASASREDLVTRLVCVRQSLDLLSPAAQ
jgi:hypothetical protein